MISRSKVFSRWNDQSTLSHNETVARRTDAFLCDRLGDSTSSFQKSYFQVVVSISNPILFDEDLSSIDASIVGHVECFLVRKWSDLSDGDQFLFG